jgi:hypothetical protein
VKLKKPYFQFVSVRGLARIQCRTCLAISMSVPDDNVHEHVAECPNREREIKQEIQRKADERYWRENSVQPAEGAA